MAATSAVPLCACPVVVERITTVAVPGVSPSGTSRLICPGDTNSSGAATPLISTLVCPSTVGSCPLLSSTAWAVATDRLLPKMLARESGAIVVP